MTGTKKSANFRDKGHIPPISTALVAAIVTITLRVNLKEPSTHGGSGGDLKKGKKIITITNYHHYQGKHESQHYSDSLKE